MRVLVFRLSSLGDILLSTSFLENLPPGTTVDWVVSSDFAFVLRGDPRIRKLWVFDRRSGLKGWFRLLAALPEEYDVRADLHRTLRTRLAFLYFSGKDCWRRGRVRRAAVSKERIRTLLLFLLKGLCPKSWCPTPYWRRFALLGRSLVDPGPSSSERPLEKPRFLPALERSGISEESVLAEYELKAGAYYALMPASRWPAKEWGYGSFTALIEGLQPMGLTPLLLGRERDRACFQLRADLKSRHLGFSDALAEPDFVKTALLLKNARFYVGCDTGISHLAEAVGCPAVVIFGPTRPELGFGPCQSTSRPVAAPVSCSPCSKDGRFCFRFFSPLQCMKSLPVSSVLQKVDEVLQK